MKGNWGLEGQEESGFPQMLFQGLPLDSVDVAPAGGHEDALVDGPE